MSNNTFLTFHHTLIAQLSDTIHATPPFNDENIGEVEQELLAGLDILRDNAASSEEKQLTGQKVVTLIIRNYSHITHSIPRDLLWYFGGECMHFLGDEEIEAFQKLDERYYDAMAEAPNETEYRTLRESLIGSDYFSPASLKNIH